MIHTEFAVLDDEELISFTLLEASHSSLEIELAQRLAIVCDELYDISVQLEISRITSAHKDIMASGERAKERMVDPRAEMYGNDTRSKSKKLS